MGLHVLEVEPGNEATEVGPALAEHGAVLLRGLGVRTADDAAAVARALIGAPVPEREGFAPRRRCGDAVASSSEWPADEEMCMHHELSYAMRVPRTIAFACLRAPGSGGATPVAGADAVLRALPPALVEPFQREGWLLTRTYGRVGMSWPAAFGTEDRAAVDAYCAANAIEREWLPEGGLRTRQRRAAVIEDGDGRRLWFNQIAFLSRWTLDPAVREYLVDVYGEDGLPYDTAYGDGRPIEPGTVGAINEAYRSLTEREPWREGDVMIVDNVRTAHAREPYRGGREIVVAQAAPACLPGHVV